MAGCRFAVEHPAATAGIVAGTMALGTCELATENHKACFTAAPIVGLGLATIAALALWLGSEDATTLSHEPQEPDYVDPNDPSVETRPTLPTPVLPPQPTPAPATPTPPPTPTPTPPPTPTPTPTPTAPEPAPTPTPIPEPVP